MEKKIAMQIQVYGRVQGVGFRYYTQKKAYELEIEGFVKNKADGSVFIEAEGIEKNLNEFLLWCHQGPTWARVKEVKFQEIPPLNYSDFKIK